MIDQVVIDGGMGASTFHARPLAALRGPIAKGGASPLLLIGPRGDWSDMASLADVRLAGIAPPSGAAEAIRRMPTLDIVWLAAAETIEGDMLAGLCAATAEGGCKRSDERRVGQGGVSKCRSRWAP